MANSSGIGGGYNAQGAADNFQDVESFVVKAATGSAFALVATATNPADAVMIDNCSPCPIKATITLADPTKGSTATKEVCTLLKAGQMKVLDYGQDVIVSVKTEEADLAAAPADAVTPCASIAVQATATRDLDILIDFFNQ